MGLIDKLLDEKNYFSLGDALDEVTFSNETKEKAKNIAKLFSKTVSNIGLFAGRLGYEWAT